MKIVDKLLQKAIWGMDETLKELEFTHIVETHKDKLDEEGRPYLSPQVMTKYHAIISDSHLWSLSIWRR